MTPSTPLPSLSSAPRSAASSASAAGQLGGRSNPETLRCKTTADFLAALPLLAGFSAEDSLFLVLFQGRRGGDVLRIDLPDPDSRHDTEMLLDGVMALLSETGAGPDGPAIVLTTSLQFGDQSEAPWARVAHQFKRRFRRRGWPLRELAVVADDGWCTMLGGSSGKRRHLDEIAASEFAAESREARSRSLASIGALPAVDAARAEAVAKHVRELEQRARSRSAHPAAEISSSRLALWIKQVTTIADRCFGAAFIESEAYGLRLPGPSGPLTPRLLAKLIDAAQKPPSWLALVLTALTRAEFVTTVSDECGEQLFGDIRVGDIRLDDRNEHTVSEPPSDPELGAGNTTPLHRNAWSIEQLLLSLSHEMPRRQKLRAAVTAMEDAVVHAPEDHRPALFALLAWAWWTLGMQSVAARMVAQALAIDPSHELTLMMQRLCENPPAAHLHRIRSEYADAA